MPPVLRVYKVDISSAKIYGEIRVGSPIVVIGKYTGIDPVHKTPVIKAYIVYTKGTYFIQKPEAPIKQ